MHGIREELIEAQAASIGIPLLKVYVFEGNNKEYEEQMKDMLLKVKARGIDKIAFGDIFLEDLKSYRENQMGQIGMDCLFPIWKTNTLQLVQNFIREGFKTYTCCINDGYLDKHWCGRIIDERFVEDLPSGIDPCGENGEFHSFSIDGPIYRKPLSIIIGEKIYKPIDIVHRDQSTSAGTIDTKGFWYCDVLLDE
ncbi:MAG TPA: ATP-binding protein, partial [Puia sp.]